MPTETRLPFRVPPYDQRSLAAAALCGASLFFDTTGWLMAILGIVLLRRAVFPARFKWMLAVIALAPKILFLGVTSTSAPPGLSFTIEPTTLATSSSLWTWSVLLAGFGVFLVFPSRPAPPAPGAPPPTETRQPFPLKLLGLAALAAAAALLLGLADGFHRIDDAGDGRWALRHAARGTMATFTRAEVASVEATENRPSRGASSYSVRVGLSDGRTFSVTTKAVSALRELREFATTADLRPGTVRIVRRRDGTWTNGAPGFTLKDYVGSYEHSDTNTGERTTIEFWREGDRLAGKESVANGVNRFVRTLRNIRASDTGELTFDPTTRAEIGKPSASTTSFSWSWSPTGESGRLTKDGLEVGAKKFTRR
ncbi:MAG TPA: hypothetical protein VGK32_12165 [Vicinamibacterales bacterium]|jgi:hypothetical protein